jgi:hypothetical protein
MTRQQAARGAWKLIDTSTDPDGSVTSTYRGRDATGAELTKTDTISTRNISHRGDTTTTTTTSVSVVTAMYPCECGATK